VTLDPTALADDLLREADLDAGPREARPASAGPALGGLRLTVVAVGWATVELDRAAAALRPAERTDRDGSAGVVGPPVVRDELLGAEARLVRRPGRPVGSPQLLLVAVPSEP
jgi:hypothetical protein